MMTELWTRFAALQQELDKCRLEVLAKEREIVEVVKQSLKAPEQRGAAFEIVNHLTSQERQQLLPMLLDLACYANRYQTEAFLAICALPRRWVAQNIGTPARQILER